MNFTEVSETAAKLNAINEALERHFQGVSSRPLFVLPPPAVDVLMAAQEQAIAYLKTQG
jgi:hypothetical protein